MPRNVTVYFADGSRHEYQGAPDDASPEQIAARAGRDFQGKQIRHLERAPAVEPETTRNPFMGAVARGAELLGSGIETLGRAGEAIGDIIAEKAPILDTRLMVDREGIRLERPTEEDIRDKNQLQYMQDWADSFRNWGREINYEPSTKLGDLADNPLNAVPFIIERVIASSPDMVAAAAALPAYIPTRANEILNERLKNDDRTPSETTIGDVAAATSAAVVEGTLERFATRRLVKEGAEAATATRRIGKEAGVQAGTEAVEEVGAYAGETVGTRAGFDPRTAGLTALEAAIVGGGLGAGVQGAREVFGDREQATPKAPPEEAPDTEEDLTPEQLAPKTGRAARPSPVRAKTLDELRGQIPAAPKAKEEEKVLREPMVFERIKEPTPEALQEAAEFVAQFPEGSKNFNLLKAKSIAKKLGYEGIPQKGVFRIDIEPLLRSAVTPRETIIPAEDTMVGQNANGEQLYERQDGSRYRMRLDRPDRPTGYPDFGGDLALVETTPATVEPKVEFKVPSDFKYTLVESPNYDFEPLSLEDADFELEVLQGQAERGRLTPQNFASSEIGKRLDTVQIGAVNEGLKTDPVGTIKALREKLTPPVAPAEPVVAAPVATPTTPPVAPAEPVVAAPAAAPAPSKSGAFAFEPEKLEALRVPEYKSREKLIELPIDDFLAMAKPGRMEAKEAETSKLLKEGTKFSSIPFLMAYIGKDGALKVQGHEGRHRALALKEAGYETLPIILRTDIRWSEQTDPKKFDYQAEWPTAIVSEDGTKTIPMPVSRDQALAPYPAPPTTPPEAPRGTEPATSETVGGAGARGAELPVSRAPARGQSPAGAGVEGLGVPNVPAARVDEREEAAKPALKKAIYKEEGESYEQGINFYYGDRYFSLGAASGMFSRPILAVESKDGNRIGDHYANNERRQVDGRVGDASQIGQYNLPPDITNAINDYLFSYSKGKEAVKAAGRKIADSINSEMAKYEPAKRVDGREEAAKPALTAPPLRIFKSIDILNRTAPDLAEQAGERTPSLRVELKKVKKDYDAGVLTGDQLAETTGDLLLKTQKERIVQPRKRGADYIRERLMNARRTGAISQEGIDLAEWFIRQNPLLVDDLGISIRGQPLTEIGTSGFYNPVGRIVTLFKGAGDSQTATHEILHHLERLMPSNIRSGILKAYVKQLTKAAKNAKTDAEKAFFNAITNYHYLSGEANQKAEYEKALDVIRNKQVPASYYQYVNPSEFWAVNGARIVQGRYGIPPGIVGQLKRWLRDFLEKAKDVFGLKSDAAIIRALDSLAKADGKYKTDELLAQAPGYRSVEPTKTGKAKPTKPKKSLGELRREASVKMMKPGVIRQVINKLTSPETNYETIAKNFQNVSRKVKKLQEDLRSAGKLISVGDDKNNIEDQPSIAANRAAYIVATEVEPVTKRLRESLASYARVMKGTIKDALEKADGYRIALHEPERRETKYLRNVPLNNTTKMEFLLGEPAMTAADARAALEKRRSLADTPQKQEAVLDMMRYLAANHADPLGSSPVKAQLEAKGKEVSLEMTTDFYDDIYNVIGTEYTQEELDATREEYEGLDAETRAAVDQVFADFDALNELNKNLNRRANYWTDKVDNVIGTYGWKHYAPFKGNPRADKTLDTDTEYLSGELSEAPESFEGRRTEFDSPILQSIAESYFAASRAGRGTDVTQTIKNLIKLNIIKSARPKVFEFEERNAPNFDYSQVQGRDKVLHYNEDGSVEVFSIKDPDMLEAIKVPYREMNLVVKIGNNLTSLFGQLHTRYNPAFAPMDLIRNTITNAGLISAREGGKEAREYLIAVAANVARLRMYKAGRLSNLLAKNNIAKLDELAKTDSFYRDALEMRKYGGVTFYRMSVNISNAMEELKEQVGPKKILTQPNMLARWIDAYNDGFELTSRVSAYTLRKQNNIAEAKKKGLNIDDPKVMEDINKEAAAFSLSLMDFRKIGKYGREMSAWFMFIRPAATGAVDAIDALRPGFFLKPKSAVEKGFARLEPEIQELFETQGLAEEIKRIQGNKRPDKKKIAALQQEIVDREKAFDAFEKRQLTRAKNARNTAMFTIATGAALYAMAVMASGEDDEGRNRVLTDDMSRWTRYLRLPVIGDKGFFQVPWGFGVSALASAGAQTAAVASGALSFKEYAGNMVEIGMDSFLPIPTSRINPFENFGAWLLDSAAPSAARPLVEFVLNVDAMGNPIYNSRSGKYADAFSGSTRPSEIHRKISELIFNTTDGEVSFSPDSIAFFLNNYADGVNHLAENSFNLVLTSMGDKNFDAKKDTFLLRSFIGRNSNYDAREYAEAEKGIKKLSQQLKTFEDLGTLEQVNKFYRENPNADILVDTYNKGRGQLSKLQTERKQILLDKSLTPKQREDYVQNVQVEMNYLKKLLVEDFEAYSGN